MLHKIPCFCSARPFQIQANIEKFNALIRKLVYSFVERCRQSENSLVAALILSAIYFRSKCYDHYRDFFALDKG